MIIVVFGIFLVNDLLRIWQPFGLPIKERAYLYIFAGFVIMGCVHLAKGSENNES
jgi:hypothetical protein